MSKAGSADERVRPLTRPEEARRRGDGQDELVLDEADNGRTIVHEDVVAKIAGTAVREVPGVHALAPLSATESLALMVGRARKDSGIRVEIGKIECAVDVRIVAQYGASIPEVARRIRENVNALVQTMTGLIVKEVNVAVVDLYFDEARLESQLPPAPEPPARQLR